MYGLGLGERASIPMPKLTLQAAGVASVSTSVQPILKAEETKVALALHA